MTNNRPVQKVVWNPFNLFPPDKTRKKIYSSHFFAAASARAYFSHDLFGTSHLASIFLERADVTKGSKEEIQKRI
jgi:hypothetical protein